MRYRPWGSMPWALSLSSPKEWNFVGSIATEERSLSCWQLIRGLLTLNAELFVQINDVDSELYRERTRAALEQRNNEFSHAGGEQTNVRTMDLMTELFNINAFAQEAEAMGTSIVLDITSLPKRFFFPLLKKLTISDQIQNLIITYTSPVSYANGALYEDIDIWKNLPGFGGIATGRENLIVSLGFLVESLNGYFATMPDHGRVMMLIPFPAPLPVLKRTWESVANLESGRDRDLFEKYRVETRDMSAAYDRIISLTVNAEAPTAFAPFGPKPTAAAMCLYATYNNSSVYYPQPTIYHPEYSVGIRDNDPATAVTAYWIKHEGENLFEN